MLDLAMLLRDSDIARQVRVHLLDAQDELRGITANGRADSPAEAGPPVRELGDEVASLGKRVTKAEGRR